MLYLGIVYSEGPIPHNTSFYLFSPFIMYFIQIAQKHLSSLIVVLSVFTTVPKSTVLYS